MSYPAHNELRISIAHVGAFAVLRVWGEIDIATTHRFRRVLEAAQRASADVAVDMSGVEFIDSTALQTLVDARQRAVVDDGRFVLAGVTNAQQRLFQISGLHDFFVIVDGLDDLKSSTTRMPG